MKYSAMVRPEVLTQPVYEPGKPIETVAREYGLNAREILKLASNENPLGPSPLGLEAAQKALAVAHLYPDGSGHALKSKLSALHGIRPEQIILGNGSNEVMVLLCQLLLRPGDEAVMGAQSFIAFKLSVLLAGATPVEVPMPGMRHDLKALAAAVTPRTRLVYLPSPNNPTGDTHSQEAVVSLVRSLPEEVVFFFDEAYAEYLDAAPDLRELIAEGRKVVCCRTFSKIYGLAAFRVGYGYADAELIGLMERMRQPFNVNAIGQAAAVAALDDVEHVRRSREVNREGQVWLAGRAAELGLDWVGTEANFALLGVENSREVFEILQRQGIIIRPLNVYSLPNYMRVTIGTRKENERLIHALEALLGDASTSTLLRRAHDR